MCVACVCACFFVCLRSACAVVPGVLQLWLSACLCPLRKSCRRSICVLVRVLPVYVYACFPNTCSLVCVVISCYRQRDPQGRLIVVVGVQECMVWSRLSQVLILTLWCVAIGRGRHQRRCTFSSSDPTCMISLSISCKCMVTLFLQPSSL